MHLTSRTEHTRTGVALILGTMTFGESVFDSDAAAFLDAFHASGFNTIDTAYVYNNGDCERMLGKILSESNHAFRVATKVNPRVTGRLDGDAIRMQLLESLQRLQVDSVDTLYLHFPDPATPLIESLETVANLHEEGRFRELGLSNFPAWMVADAWHICGRHGWVLPTVYEGMYNPLSRRAECELDACLTRFGIRFNAYNPLCGGLLTGRYTEFGTLPTVGRFANRPNYLNRYWKASLFEATDVVSQAACEHGIPIAEASYKWLAYHSMLDGSRGDGIIIGASSLNHLIQNLAAAEAGPLPEGLIAAFERAWVLAKGESPEYFTLYLGKGSVGGEGA